MADYDYYIRQNALKITTLRFFHPLNREASKFIENDIFKECKNVINKGCENDRYDSFGLRP